VGSRSPYFLPPAVKSAHNDRQTSIEGIQMRGRLPIILTFALLAASLPAHATADETAWAPVTPVFTPPENLSGVGFNDLAAVSPADVWAVGGGWSDIEEPLIAHWTGAGWRPVEEPPAPNFQYSLSAIDAVSARDVWAVGNGMVSPAPDFHPLAVIAHYDGATWSLVPVPEPPPSSSDVLTDVDMMSATDGWAVGWRAGPPTEGLDLQPLVMRWRNGRWVTVSLPDIGGDNTTLAHVYARARDDVWAVGAQGDSALVMHFDGNRWRRVAVPHGGVADAENGLRAVTAVSAGDVWAVGAACVPVVDGAACQPLILHLSGGVWRVVPTAGDHGTNLQDVVARSSDDVWAVGYDLPQGGQEANYVEHWDGQRFATVSTDAGSLAVLGDLASALEAVTRLPGTAELWAVGWRENGVPQVIRHG
jgi:hypothetical protein